MNASKFLYTFIIAGIIAVLAPAYARASAPVSPAEILYSQYKKANLDYQGMTTHQIAAIEKQHVVFAKNTLSLALQKRYLRASESIPSDQSSVVSLAKLITQDAQNDIERLILLHNFVLWRMTHAAIFFEDPANPKALKSRKGRLVLCMQKSEDHGDSNAWVKPPLACGLKEVVAPENNDTLALLNTGTHNCWGFAYLFATLARASGFPTQTVQQNPVSLAGAHVWNRVFVLGAWRVLDTTFDDANDDGTYEDTSKMELDYTYFLISDKEAAQKDPENHRRYSILED